IYHHPNVSLIRGDVSKADDVARAISGTPIVINLAHGGGGADWPAIEAALVGSARVVAQACLAAGVKRLLHIGSIAGLYLGDGAEIITGATPPDRQADNRGDYARAKALADNMLLQMFRDKKLPVVILRPGVVVGEGSSPFHSGLGFFNNDQHCLGWNNGNNPLPFVLAQDVAEAIISACEAEGIEGKCYNLVGGAQMSARNYVAALGAAMQRPLCFHGQSAVKLQAVEIGKWLVKRAAGRDAGFPSYRDLLSRGMMARFDCSDTRRDLNWRPVDDKQDFIARAITIFTPATM
ncbi:MAG TPA: NAD-dependent epimerase/dehydratase family protein, partial [Alphaproteobacteria bacterium]|nr:NAD-dependent epimerase/dehydratase family protein [Alphaproteobacteria bacterium]